MTLRFIFMSNIKTSADLSADVSRLYRVGRIITCTERQVGRLSSVSLLPTSGCAGRPAIRRLNSASLIRDVGLTGRSPDSGTRVQQKKIITVSDRLRRLRLLHLHTEWP